MGRKTACNKKTSIALTSLTLIFLYESINSNNRSIFILYKYKFLNQIYKKMISFPGDVQPARLGPDGDDPEHQPVDELRPQESFPERPEDQKKGKKTLFQF